MKRIFCGTGNFWFCLFAIRTGEMGKGRKNIHQVTRPWLSAGNIGQESLTLVLRPNTSGTLNFKPSYDLMLIEWIMFPLLVLDDTSQRGEMWGVERADPPRPPHLHPTVSLTKKYPFCFWTISLEVHPVIRQICCYTVGQIWNHNPTPCCLN